MQYDLYASTLNLVFVFNVWRDRKMNVGTYRSRQKKMIRDELYIKKNVGEVHN